MSIDSEEKRKSAASIVRPAGPTPTPNASPDQEWRQEVALSYSGILAASPGDNHIAVKVAYYRMMGMM